MYGRDSGGTPYPAWALSDGTLRLLALAVLGMDPESQGLLCLEEPENGIHPARIPAMLELLLRSVVDTRMPVGPDNPLRQVIVNTHSPSVVRQVPEDSILFVGAVEARDKAGHPYTGARFSCLTDSWRARGDQRHGVVGRDDLLAYLTAAFADDQSVDDTAERKPQVVALEETAQLSLLSIC